MIVFGVAKSALSDTSTHNNAGPRCTDGHVEARPEIAAIKIDEAAISNALRALEAVRFRTGTKALRSDLHRVVRKYLLSSIDAAELEARAQDAELLEVSGDSGDVGEPTEATSDSMKMFLDDARRFKLLRPGEPQQLARAISVGREAETALAKPDVDERFREHLESLAQEGQRAFARFVASNIRLVMSIAKNYTNQGLDLLDLIQEGCFGLIRAVELYEPQQGVQFSTYAYYWIAQTITRAIADQSRLIRLPVHAHDRLNRIRRATRDLSYRLGREPTYSEVAEHLGLQVEQVLALSQWLERVVSLETPLGSDGDLTLKDVLPDRNFTIDDQVANAQRRELIGRLVSESLTPREAAVVTMRFGLRNHKRMTLEEIGRHFGLTRERIRQIESKALKRLKHKAEKYKLALLESDK